MRTAVTIPEPTQQTVIAACAGVGNDPNRLLDVLHAVQDRLRRIDDDAIDAVASILALPRVDVASTAAFYHFFSRKGEGKVAIRVCDDVVDRLKGYDAVMQAFEEGLGIRCGETTPDGRYSLHSTSCIGMSDQAPAALVNDVVVTKLTPAKVKSLIYDLRQHLDPQKLVQVTGDGVNSHPKVRAMVLNNIQKRGPVIFTENTVNGRGLQKALSMSSEQVIREMREAGLRGHGGAGFLTGMKWSYVLDAKGPRKFVVANADEGEPGTFKDRVLLTERPDLVIEGMTIAGWAVGAREGILYLRGEYAYLKDYLEEVLEQRRGQNLLGKRVCGKDGFDFDVRIQLGAGAYVCGEETALLSSAEGKPGIPKTRPPFPAKEGYLRLPTTINNIETLACATRILENGPRWFSNFGTMGSRGTKLLSVCGDCGNPGIYEVVFGVKLREVLEMDGGEDAQAVQVGGPSGRMIGPREFDRIIDYDDLSTGGSIVIFGQGRDLVRVVRCYMDFFVNESCGFCVPCRVGNVLIAQALDKVLEGRADESDLESLNDLCRTVKSNSRCGLGVSSPNGVLQTLRNFRPAYNRLLRKPNGSTAFDVKRALGEAEDAAGRSSEIFGDALGA
jgi:[NiFe] hydrogenase diaphorase moiety large subunit